MTRAALQRKYEQSDRFRHQQLEEMKGLWKVKEEFELKKRQIKDIFEESLKTGDMGKIHEELGKLKAHAAEMEVRAKQEWAERSATSSPTKVKLRPWPHSARSSPMPSTSRSSPASPGRVHATPLRLQSSGPRLNSPSVFSRSESSKLSPPPLLPPGSHYAHLMSLFKVRTASPKEVQFAA